MELHIEQHLPVKEMLPRILGESKHYYLLLKLEEAAPLIGSIKKSRSNTPFRLNCETQAVTVSSFQRKISYQLAKKFSVQLHILAGSSEEKLDYYTKNSRQLSVKLQS